MESSTITKERSTMSIDFSQLAIQSFCFRGFGENSAVIKALKACGCDAVELSAVHADFNDPDGFSAIIGQYHGAGIDIISIGVEAMGNNEAAERKRFEFVKQCGAGHMSVDFDPDSIPASYRTAERLAEEYDITLGIHNHGGRHWLGSSRMLAHVFANTSERIGLCLDTAWALDSGEDPVAMVEQFGDRVHSLHFKDFVFDRARKPEDVVVGEGNLDLPGLLKALDNVGFEGPAILEYEGDVDDPVPAVSNCVKAMREGT